MESNVVTINKREFLLWPNKYIKMLQQGADRIVVTTRGSEEIVVTLASKVATKVKDVVTKASVATEQNVATEEVEERYGCGCKKESGKYLCKKHSRS